MSGWSPIKDDIILTRGADWIHKFTKDQSDPPFPSGTSAEVVLTESSDTDAPVLASWPAENVSPSSIEFVVQSEQTDMVEARTRYRLLVHYPPVPPSTVTQDWVWFRGAIKREQ